MRGFILGILLSVGTLASADVGFTVGNELTATQLSGDLMVICDRNGQFRVGRTFCEDVYLEGDDKSYLESDQVIDATKVRLVSTQASGRVVKAKSKYLSEEGRSKKEFRLWRPSLFQGALLDVGENNIEYIFSTRLNKSVRSGSFRVNVNLEGSRTCERGTIRSFNLSDCDFPDRLCSEYYYQQNFCE